MDMVIISNMNEITNIKIFIKMESKTNVENIENNSLMRKTKTQLIDIILRKDSVERQLRGNLTKVEEEARKITIENDSYKETVKSLNNKYMNLVHIKNKFDTLKEDYQILKSDFETICDEKADIEYKYKTYVKYLQKGIIIIAILFIIGGIITLFI